MNHHIVFHVMHPSAEVGDEFGRYDSVEEILAAHPEIAKKPGGETVLRRLKGRGDSALITADILVWCEDVATPEDYSAGEFALGQRYHAALLALASAIETASGAAIVHGSLIDDVRVARIQCRVGADLSALVHDRMFETMKEPPRPFETWLQRTEDHIRIGAGPKVIRADATELMRNIGLATKGTPS